MRETHVLDRVGARVPTTPDEAPGRTRHRRPPPVAHPRPGADDLVIAGLVPLSTCDWPGRLVATVFLQGCPWRCTYCHNPDLLDPHRPGTVAWQAVRDLLARRRGLLDGVVFSGGEPTRQDGLAAAMREVREAGFCVGLHTAGAYPGRLAAVLPLVDWVGLDVKAPADRYRAVTGVAASAARAQASLLSVLEAGVDVQVRTTVDPTVLTGDDVARLTRALAARGVHDHVLQQVRAPGGATPARESRPGADPTGRPGKGRDVGPRASVERVMRLEVLDTCVR